ncbi:spore germination protein GerPB [Paenibacillus cymbidii]|uniref:spore germination protein GerPB n=1 Tax=Paenibacillus cymbidii TaxID=1639034 RepID=UPI00108221BC|nr:spore germination protein GerPB [Paenibacillus cymbidii]
MTITVHQSIAIGQFRVDSVSDASVLIIGTAGTISSLANSYNSGAFPEGKGEVGQKISPFVVPLPATS